MPSVYEIVTEKIIKQLESGVAPWRKPWTSKTPANLVTQKEYRGLNVLTLASQGFPSRFWLTFNQASKLGGTIRKGEKSSPVIFWNVSDANDTASEDGEAPALRNPVVAHTVSKCDDLSRLEKYRAEKMQEVEKRMGLPQ